LASFPQRLSAWETAAQLGHKSREHRTTELYAPFDPDYLSTATVAIDAFFDGLLASYSPVPKPYFLPERPQVTDSKEENGAGDEISIFNLPAINIEVFLK